MGNEYIMWICGGIIKKRRLNCYTRVGWNKCNKITLLNDSTTLNYSIVDINYKTLIIH